MADWSCEAEYFAYRHEVVINTFNYYSVNHQSSLPKNTFSKLSYIYFFNTLKCAPNYVFQFEVYDGFIIQNIKLWRQESWLFGPGLAADILRIRSWTSYGSNTKRNKYFLKKCGMKIRLPLQKSFHSRARKLLSYYTFKTFMGSSPTRGTYIFYFSYLKWGF